MSRQPTTPSTGSSTPTYTLPAFAFPSTGGTGSSFVTPTAGAGAPAPLGGWLSTAGGTQQGHDETAAAVDAIVGQLRSELQRVKDDSWKFEAPRHQLS